MSKRFKSVGIEDISVENIDPELRDHLIELFTYTVRSITPTLIREAHFNTDDFATARQRDCLGFELCLKREVIDGTTLWCGNFDRGNQTLKVMGTLE